jgi:hypothetical protein
MKPPSAQSPIAQCLYYPHWGDVYAASCKDITPRSSLLRTAFGTTGDNPYVVILPDALTALSHLCLLNYPASKTAKWLPSFSIPMMRKGISCTRSISAYPECRQTDSKLLLAAILYSSGAYRKIYALFEKECPSGNWASNDYFPNYLRKFA